MESILVVSPFAALVILWTYLRNRLDQIESPFSNTGPCLPRPATGLAATHEIDNLRVHRANGDVATLLALRSNKPRRCKPYLYELLHEASVAVAWQPKA